MASRNMLVTPAVLQVSRRVLTNPSGLVPGHAWMEYDAGAVPAAAVPSLQVVHAAMPPPARGAAKDLLLLQHRGTGCDVNIKVSRRWTNVSNCCANTESV